MAGRVGTGGLSCLLDCVEPSERLSKTVAGDALIVDVEAVEDGLVEHAALLLVAASVELLRILQQSQSNVDEPGAVGEALGCRGQAFGQAPSIACDLAELRFDLRLRDGGVGCQLDEVLLARVQRPQLGGELLAEEPLGGILLVDDAGDVRADIGDELGTEANRRVVRLDGVFDEGHVEVGRLARAVLLVAAEEVGVLVTSPVDGVLDDHPLGDARALATAAEQRALEVVVVHPPALLGRPARVEDVLDLVEEVVVDQRFVAALDFLALVRHVAQVVAVPQHLGEFVDRHAFGGVLRGGPGTQSAIVELVSEVVEAVVAGGVELESQLHQRRTVGVDRDGADLAAVEPVDDVEVAQRGTADGAAAAGLLAHLVGDVGAGLPRLVLVEGREDAVHELPDGCVVDGFGGRHERDPTVAQIGHDDGVVEPVARHPGQLVDDDVVDIAAVPHPCEHPLEGDSFGHLRGGAPGLDVLVDDGQTELFGFALAGDALRWDGDSFGVVVGLDLTRR